VSEVVVTEELELDLIRVDHNPKSLFEYQLIYKAGNATGMVGVYSFDEDWYYLYKQDTERYKVKRCKELEGIEPTFTYKQQRKRPRDKQDKQKSLKQNTVVKPLTMEVDLKIASDCSQKTLDMNQSPASSQDDTSFEVPEQNDPMQMGGI